MAGVSFVASQFAVQLANWNIRIPSMIIFYPFQLLLRMRIRMRTFGSVAFGFQRRSCSIVLFVPAHQRRLGHMIFAACIWYVSILPVKLYCMNFCRNFMWTIPLVLCYTWHGGWVLSVSFCLWWTYSNRTQSLFLYLLWSHINCNSTSRLYNAAEKWLNCPPISVIMRER